MATWDDVRRCALALPGATERPSWGTPAWRTNDRLFVWDRPLRGTDLAELGAAAPDGPIVGFYVADAGEKAALLAEDPTVFFTVAHLDGHPIALGRLDRIDVDRLTELVVESWLIRAPTRLAREYLDTHDVG